MTNWLIDLHQLDQVYIVCGRTDLRKGIDGLATLIQEEFDLSPFKSALFLFVAVVVIALKVYIGRATALFYYISGLKTAIYNGPRSQSEVRQLSQQQLTWLLDGLSVEATIHRAQIGAFYGSIISVVGN